MNQQPGSIGNVRRPGADDIYRKIADLQRQIDAITSTNTLAAAELGSGSGITVKGGAITLEDLDGNTLATLDSDGLTIHNGGSVTVDDGGDVIVNDGGSVTVNDGGSVTVDGGGSVVIKDASGTTQAKLGRLNASPAIYGLGVLPHGGTELQQVAGVLSSQELEADSVSTSGAIESFGGGITAEIGPSGAALIGGSFEIITEDAGVEGAVNINVDSSSNSFQIAGLFIDGGSGSCLGGSTLRVDGLSVGSHTFTAAYWSQNGSATFFGYIFVQPL